MKKSNILVLIVSLSFFYLLTGCDKDVGPFYTGDALTDGDTISFSKDIQPIFDAYCVSCHNQTHAKLNLLSCCSYDQLLYTGFSAAYVDTINPTVSRIHRYLIGKPTIMPPTGAIPQPEIDKILHWIKNGAKNN